MARSSFELGLRLTCEQVRIAQMIRGLSDMANPGRKQYANYCSDLRPFIRIRISCDTFAKLCEAHKNQPEPKPAPTPRVGVKEAVRHGVLAGPQPGTRHLATRHLISRRGGRDWTREPELTFPLGTA